MVLAEWSKQAFSSEHGTDAGHPSLPTQVRHQDRHEGDHGPQRYEEVKDVPFRIGTPLLDETHVVHEHQAADRASFGFNGGGRHMHGPVTQRQNRRRTWFKAGSPFA